MIEDLKNWMDKNDRGPNWVSNQLGVKPVTIWRWFQGIQPRKKNINKIRELIK